MALSAVSHTLFTVKRFDFEDAIRERIEALDPGLAETLQEVVRASHAESSAKTVSVHFLDFERRVVFAAPSADGGVIVGKMLATDARSLWEQLGKVFAR